MTASVDRWTRFLNVKSGGSYWLANSSELHKNVNLNTSFL